MQQESFDGAFTAVGLRDYSICAVDFPGHGESSRGWPAEFYTLQAYADITEQVITRLMGPRMKSRPT
jgi:pimeloyl-ACP methyl ester carboxylesterase